MITATLGTIPKKYKQPKSIDGRIEKICSVIRTHNGILLSHKKYKILTFVTIQVDLEGIMLSEIRQRQIPYDFFYMRNLKAKTNKHKKQNS